MKNVDTLAEMIQVCVHAYFKVKSKVECLESMRQLLRGKRAR